MDDTEHGLAFEPDDDWDPDILRAAAATLWQDVGNNHAAFAEKSEVDFGGIGERLRPDDDGLRLGVDGDRLSEDLARLREHEADRKLSALLDKAERAIDAGRIEDAWTHVEAALEIAPTNVRACLLGARCQHALGAFETALDLLATARQHARGAAEVTLVVRLRDAAVIELVNEVGLHAHGLLELQGAAVAVEYVERKVARNPQILGLHYIRGALLFQGDRLTEARDVVEALLTEDEAVGIEAFTELHQSILAEICAPKAELARQSLRAGRPKEAIDHLTACGEALHDSGRYAGQWSYAHEQYAKNSKVPFVGWRRARRSDTEPLDVEGLQEVLVWLLSEEIDAAMSALHDADFGRAGRCCVRAEAIDSRCGGVAYLHAIAETCAASMVLKKIDMSTLADAQRHLTVAARLVTKVAADPSLTDRGNVLGTRIAADRVEVARLIRFVSCMSRFNALMTRLERQPIRTRDELYRAKSELRSLRAVADASKREHKSPAEGQVLDDLTGAIEALLWRLPA